MFQTEWAKQHAHTDKFSFILFMNEALLWFSRIDEYFPIHCMRIIANLETPILLLYKSTMDMSHPNNHSFHYDAGSIFFLVSFCCIQHVPVLCVCCLWFHLFTFWIRIFVWISDKTLEIFLIWPWPLVMWIALNLCVSLNAFPIGSFRKSMRFRFEWNWWKDFFRLMLIIKCPHCIHSAFNAIQNIVQSRFDSSCNCFYFPAHSLSLSKIQFMLFKTLYEAKKTWTMKWEMACGSISE